MVDATRIEDVFDIEVVPAVRRSLEEHDGLAPLLIKVSRRVPRYFPAPTRIQLRLQSDRDEGNHIVLFAVIQTDLLEDETVLRLDRFDEEWWLEAHGLRKGRLTVDVESNSKS